MTRFAVLPLFFALLLAGPALAGEGCPHAAKQAELQAAAAPAPVARATGHEGHECSGTCDHHQEASTQAAPEKPAAAIQQAGIGGWLKRVLRGSR